MAKKDTKTITAAERDALVAGRMTESRGALNQVQAEVAVDLQLAEDGIKVAEAKPAAE